MNKRTSGRQQGYPTRRPKANAGRRTFLKTALGWTADQAAGGVVQAAVLSGGAALLRGATSPQATVISASSTPWESVLTPGPGSLVLVGEVVRLELTTTGQLEVPQREVGSL